MADRTSSRFRTSPNLTLSAVNATRVGCKGGCWVTPRAAFSGLLIHSIFSTLAPVGSGSGMEGNMVLNVHRNHKAYYGRGEWGKGVWRWGKRVSIYL